MLVPVNVLAKDKQRIFDDANLLTEMEIVQLEKVAAKHSKKRKTDFVVLTTSGEHGIDIQKYMDDFYDDQGLGYDKKHGNTVLLGIDIKNSDVMIMGFYKAEDYLDNERATKVRDEITPHLSDGKYFAAFEKFIVTADRYMKYRPGVNPDNIFFKTFWQLIFALVTGAIITFIMVRHTNPKVTTTAATYRNDQYTRILSKRDRYIRTSVTKKYRPRNKNNRRGGGGGGGSSYGRTSGGHSYSGSRGKF